MVEMWVDSPLGFTPGLFPLIKMGFKDLKKVVDQCQVPNALTAIKHYNDLKYTAMRLHNELAVRLRKHNLRPPFMVDFVTSASKFVKKKEENSDVCPLKWAIRVDEQSYKEEFIRFYYNEPMEYKKPYAVADVARFRRARNRAKDVALEIVIKLCDAWCKEELKAEATEKADT